MKGKITVVVQQVPGLAWYVYLHRFGSGMNRYKLVGSFYSHADARALAKDLRAFLKD